jgi:hypothetical protein
VNEAFPGDVMGLVGHCQLRALGGYSPTQPTQRLFTMKSRVSQPEAFSYLHHPNTGAKYKQFPPGP